MHYILHEDTSGVLKKLAVNDADSRLVLTFINTEICFLANMALKTGTLITRLTRQTILSGKSKMVIVTNNHSDK